MAENYILRDRNDPAGFVALSGRTEADNVDVYALTLFVSPTQIQPGQATAVSAVARKNGAYLPGQLIQFSTTNAGVGFVPVEGVETGSSGSVSFQIVGETLGTANIRAFMNIGGTYNGSQPPTDGINVSSQIITLMVVGAQAPENYNATGYGSIVLVIENHFSNALFPKVQRLSHMEQKAKYPGANDTGLSRVADYENREVEFIPAWWPEK